MPEAYSTRHRINVGVDEEEREREYEQVEIFVFHVSCRSEFQTEFEIRL